MNGGAHSPDPLCGWWSTFTWSLKWMVEHINLTPNVDGGDPNTDLHAYARSTSLAEPSPSSWNNIFLIKHIMIMVSTLLNLWVPFHFSSQLNPYPFCLSLENKQTSKGQESNMIKQKPTYWTMSKNRRKRVKEKAWETCIDTETYLHTHRNPLKTQN